MMMRNVSIACSMYILKASGRDIGWMLLHNEFVFAKRRESSIQCEMNGKHWNQLWIEQPEVYHLFNFVYLRCAHTIGLTYK